MSEFKKLAEKKIKEEKNKAEKLSQKAGAIKVATFDAVMSFIEQDDEFAQAVYQSDKTFGDCLEHCVDKCGNSISDITVFERAVDFYFPGAKIRFQMEVQVNPFEDAASSPNNSSGAIVLSLDDFLM